MGQIKLPNGLCIYFNKSLVRGPIWPWLAGWLVAWLSRPVFSLGRPIFLSRSKGKPNFGHLIHKQQRVTDNDHNGFAKGQGDRKF